MIDLIKITKTMTLNKLDGSCFPLPFRMTTVKLDQKSNINEYCIIFCPKSSHIMTIKKMVVVFLATIINSAINHVLNGSCLSISRIETNFEGNLWFPFNLYLTEGLNEA